MQSASVHIAVLAIARDAAPTKAVSELVTAAGHQVVARAMVMDAQAAIRSQLTRWIEDANIDVVIVAGGAESTNVSAAMKPLVSETLPGFTDLFRYLAFQEIGASAMLSNAEAARCTTTFVFVLPANEGAVRAALAKLILPQLDSNTTPQNLVTSMPRLREVVTDAVPAVIAQEKTAGGSGFAPRSPALATPPRGRPVTGANIVARRQTNDDPPTKPIDVAKLEQQIAISEAGSATTKQIDLSRLPRLPPGADDTLSDVPLPAEPSRNGRAARLESEPIAPPKSSSPRQQPLPSIRKPPTEPPPAPRKIQRTEPSAVVPPAKPAPARVRATSAAPAAKPPTMPSSGPTTKPTTVPPTVPAMPRTRPRTEPPPPPPAPPVARTRPPTEPPAPRARPASQPPPPPPGERGPRPERAETRSVPIGTPTGAIPTVELPEELDAAAPLPIRERSAPVGKPAVTEPATEPVSDPAAAVRLPSPRKRETTDLAALVAPSLSGTTGDLPLGEFNYPIKKSGNKVVWLLALLAAGALGFVAVVFLVPRLTSSGSAANDTPVPEQPVAAATLDAAATAEPAPSVEPIDEALEAPAPTAEVTPTPTPAPATTEPPVRPARDRQRPATQKPPDAAARGSAAVAATEPAEEPEEEPPVAPPISASDCDEVACVLAKYDRPCCEKYRPKGTDMKPRGAGGIPTGLDKMAVRAGIQKIKPRVVACGEKTSDKGTVKISVSVKPDGSVSNASVDSSPSAALGDCVAAALRKAEFAKTVNGGTFTYPFVF